MNAVRTVSVLWVGLVFTAAARLASAAPIALVGTDNTSPVALAAGLRTCKAHVQFDDPQDNLLSVGFSDISTNAPEGFFQHVFGSDLPPNPVFCTIEGLELMCSDSFVTIGGVSSTLGVTATDGDFNSQLFNPPAPQGEVVGGWFDVSGEWDDPCSPDICQGDLNGDGGFDTYDLAFLLGAWGVNPGSPADFNGDGLVDAIDLALLLGEVGPNTNGVPDANLQVLIAQFTVQAGFNIQGTTTVFFNTGQLGIPLSFECFVCLADLSGDGMVDAFDLAIMLGAWGPNRGHPADLNGDGVVDATDLAVLLGTWGACP